MSGAITFIQECLTSERERNSVIGTSAEASSTAPHTLLERQWAPVNSSAGNDKELPLAVCWDHSGFYCAEGSNTGDVTIWNFAENTAPYNAFDRQGAVSFRAASVEEENEESGREGSEHKQQHAKSACLAWSDTCHRVYLASNYSATAASRLTCWSLTSGDEWPVCTKLLPFEVHALHCLPTPSSPSPSSSPVLAIITTTGACYLANSSMDITDHLSFDTSSFRNPTVTLSLLPMPIPPCPSEQDVVTVSAIAAAAATVDPSSSSFVRTRAMCPAQSVTDTCRQCAGAGVPAMLVLVSVTAAPATATQLDTQWILLRVEARSSSREEGGGGEGEGAGRGVVFTITHQVSLSSPPPPSSSLAVPEQALPRENGDRDRDRDRGSDRESDSMEVCVSQEHQGEGQGEGEGEDDDLTGSNCSLQLCASSAEVLVTISPSSSSRSSHSQSHQLPLVQLRRAQDLGMLHDLSRYLADPVKMFGGAVASHFHFRPPASASAPAPVAAVAAVAGGRGLLTAAELELLQGGPASEPAAVRVRVSVVGGGFTSSCRYEAVRYVALCFNTHTHSHSLDHSLDHSHKLNTPHSHALAQWVCYFRIDQLPAPPLAVPVTAAAGATPTSVVAGAGADVVLVSKSPLLFSHWTASYPSSCLLGIQAPPPAPPLSSSSVPPQSPSVPHPPKSRGKGGGGGGGGVFYAADEKLYSYFAGANFPAGFVVLDRAQLFVEHEDETDIVVQKPLPAHDCSSGTSSHSHGHSHSHVSKGKRSAAGGDQRGSSSKRSRGVQKKSADPVIDIWSNDNDHGGGSVGAKNENPFALYEDIDQQGYELECYLSREMQRRKQWSAAGGWSAHALPPVSLYSPATVTSASTSTVVAGTSNEKDNGELAATEEENVGADENPNININMHVNNSDSNSDSSSTRGGVAGAGVHSTLDEEASSSNGNSSSGRNRRSACLTTANSVPQRVLGEQNIAVRAAEEAQVNRRILGTIFKTYDKTKEIKRRIAEAIAVNKREKEVKKEHKRMTQDVAAAMEMILKTVEDVIGTEAMHSCNSSTNTKQIVVPKTEGVGVGEEEEEEKASKMDVVEPQKREE